jgi:starvation-inducible DNA-binding protein
VAALQAVSRWFESDISHHKYFKKIMDELYQSLHKAQTSLFCLMQKTWVYHWNVVGSDFFELHEAFGEQYTAMQGELDRLTEHMRYLRMKAISSISRVVETCEIPEASTNPTDKSMVSQLLSDNKKMIELLTSVVEESEKTKQYTTSNIAQDLIETHGKFVWMLRSYLKE